MIQENISVVLMILKHLLGSKSHVSAWQESSKWWHFDFLAAKPLYDFYKELPAKMEVFRTKQTVLECHVNDPNAPVKWYKNGHPIDVSKSPPKKALWKEQASLLSLVDRWTKINESNIIKIWLDVSFV